LTFRELFEYPDLLNVVVVNDIAPVESSAYLGQFDTVHGDSFLPSIIASSSIFLFRLIHASTLSSSVLLIVLAD
jgi:hypothetical protein